MGSKASKEGPSPPGRELGARGAPAPHAAPAGARRKKGRLSDYLFLHRALSQLPAQPAEAMGLEWCPRELAEDLLLLGTAVFPAGLLALATCTTAGSAARVAGGQLFALYAAVILAFIGGLQQAAGIADGKPRAAALVAGGIALALAAWAACAYAVAAGNAAAAAQGLTGLGLLYGAQGALERYAPWYTHLSPVATSVLLVEARAVPMLAATVALLLAAWLVR